MAKHQLNTTSATPTQTGAGRGKTRCALLLAGVIGVLAAAAGQAHASPPPRSWELGAEFDDGHNPSGVWSYGWSATLTSPFVLDTGTVAYGANSEMKGWQNSPTNIYPLHAHNTLMVPFLWTNFINLSILYPARAVTTGPGSNCEFSTIRFTAPMTAKYKVSGVFYGQDSNGSATNTKVYLLANNTTIWAGAVQVAAGLDVASFTTKTAGLNAGQTLDFKVGCGPNFNYQFGSTGIHAVIQAQ